MLACGDFTLAYHDNGDFTLHRGKHEYDDLPKRELSPGIIHSEGYAPAEVVLLVEALHGKVVSIQ